MIFSALLWTALMHLFLKYKKMVQGVNVFLSIISILIILYMTVISRSESRTEVILLPFHSFLEAQTQPELYRSMLMNVFLFVPFGLTLPYALPNRCRHKWMTTILSAMLFSIIIETSQFCFQLGRCEVDDVIMNTLGAAIGSWGYGLTIRK